MRSGRTWNLDELNFSTTEPELNKQWHDFYMDIYTAPTRNSTCAIVITYNPDPSFNERLAKISQQFSSVVIVDNASSRNLRRELIEPSESIHVIDNEVNEGIAAALNRGVEKAIEKGFQWFVTFDQDSAVDQALLSSLCEIQAEVDCPTVIIGSNYWSTNKSGLAHCCKHENMSFVERKTVISSGMLFSKILYEEVGSFNADYFIDSVDHEFCLRARRKNFKVLLSCKPLMEHSIGECRKTDGLMGGLVFSHSEDRVYYMTRNTIVTIIEFFGREPLWSCRQVARLAIEFLAICLDMETRGLKVTAFVRGVRDGFLGRKGVIRK